MLMRIHFQQAQGVLREISLPPLKAVCANVRVPDGWTRAEEEEEATWIKTGH